jgi:hypothetical protein
LRASFVIERIGVGDRRCERLEAMAIDFSDPRTLGAHQRRFGFGIARDVSP